MKSLVLTSPAFEALEPRQLRSVAASTPAEGQDHHLTLDASGAVVVTSSADPVARKPLPAFKWFDGTQGHDIVAAGGTAFVRGWCDSWHMWPFSPAGGKDTSGKADESQTRLMAREAADAGFELVVLDNESWHFDIRYHSRATVSETIAGMQQVIGWIRDERPSLKVGIYGYMSQSDDSESVQWPISTEQAALGESWHVANLPRAADSFARWQATSEYLRPLSESVDYLFPALYTGIDDADRWERSARLTIEDSRRYGKPVIPFIWPRFHPGGSMGADEAELPVAFWERQLDLVSEHADGAYLWDRHATPEGAAWLEATLARTMVHSQPMMIPLPLHAGTSTSDDEAADRQRSVSHELLLAA